jgi:hypothetical protein
VQSGQAGNPGDREEQAVKIFNGASEQEASTLGRQLLWLAPKSMRASLPLFWSLLPLVFTDADLTRRTFTATRTSVQEFSDKCTNVHHGFIRNAGSEPDDPVTCHCKAGANNGSVANPPVDERAIDLAIRNNGDSAQIPKEMARTCLLGCPSSGPVPGSQVCAATGTCKHLGQFSLVGAAFDTFWRERNGMTVANLKIELETRASNARNALSRSLPHEFKLPFADRDWTMSCHPCTNESYCNNNALADEVVVSDTTATECTCGGFGNERGQGICKSGFSGPNCGIEEEGFGAQDALAIILAVFLGIIFCCCWCWCTICCG